MNKVSLATLLLVFVSITSFSQNTKSIIAVLNDKAKETHGILRQFNNSKVKVEIADNEIKASEMGVQIMVKLDQEGFPVSTYTYDFNPADIVSVEDMKLPKESPVGQVKITLKDNLSLNTNFTKKDKTTRIFFKEVTFNFLKVDETNVEKVRELFFKLRDGYTDAESLQMKELKAKMSTYKDFWMAFEGSSKTYKLRRVELSECELRFYYHLEEITKKGDKSKYYLTIVPLKEIDDISLDKAKSRPNCVLLKAAGKKGFERFVFSDGKYVEDGFDKEIPLFVDATSYRHDEAIEILKKQVKSCGGGKIKL
jgi:hypothetical protein